MSEQPVGITIAECAELLRCSQKTVRRRITAGKIPTILVTGKRLIPEWWVACARNKRDKPELNEELLAHISKLVDQAPPLSEAQKSRLAALFAGTVKSQTRELPNAA